MQWGWLQHPLPVPCWEFAAHSLVLGSPGDAGGWSRCSVLGVIVQGERAELGGSGVPGGRLQVISTLREAPQP